MEQRSNDAAMKDATIKFREVEGGVCVRHGGKTLCRIEGCTNQVQCGGVCIRHGAKIKTYLCSSEGCPNQAVKGGVCVRHGAKVK